MDTSTDKYLQALRRFADAGDLQMARSVVNSMSQRDVEVGAEHLGLLLQANLAGRDPAGARAVLARMRDAGMEVDPTVRYDLAITTARAGRLGDAVAELDTLHDEGVRPAAGQLQELLSIHVRAKRFPAARAMLRRLASEGMAARRSDYDALFADLHERKAIKDSIAQVELMFEAGSPPTPADGAKLVAMMAEAGHPDRATTLLDMLWERDVEVPVAVLSDVLDAHARAGDAAEVAATVERMAEVGAEPNSFHRNAMLAARLNADDLEGAWTMVLDLLDAGRIPTGENVETLFDQTLAAGNLARASGVVDLAMIIGVPIAPHRVAQAIEGHLKADELATARWLFDETAKQGVPRDRRAARGIVEETIRGGDLDGARTLLKELLDTGTLTHGRHWGSLLRALLGANRLDDAVAVVGELVETNRAPAAADLLRVVHALLDANRPKPAFDLSMAALKANMEVDATNWSELLWLFAKPKHVEQVDAIAAYMQERGVELEHRHAKAVAHARGEELPDPEPAPAPTPAVPAPAVEDAATPTQDAPADGPADWELAIEGAITATPSAGAAPQDAVTEQGGTGTTPASLGGEADDVAPDESVDPAAAAVPDEVLDDAAAAPAVADVPAAATDPAAERVEPVRDPVNPTPAPEVLPDAAPDEAVDAALVEATTGAAPTPVAEDPSAGPSGVLGETAATTPAVEATGAAPGQRDEQAPADQHVATEPAAGGEDATDEDEEPTAG